jgi:hypothetical protein
LRNAAAFRLVSHICIFYSAAVLFPQFLLPYNTAYLIIAAAALFACLAAVYIDLPALRVPVSLVPLGVLLFILKPTAVTAALIVNALPLIYAAVILMLGRFHGEVWVYRKEVQRLALFIAPLLALTISSQAGFLNDAEQIGALPYAWALYFFFVFFALLALRTMRSGVIRSAKWQGGTIGVYLLAAAFAAVLGFLLRFALPVFKFILMLLVLPIGLILWLLGMAMGIFASNCAGHLGDLYATVPPVTLSPEEQAAVAAQSSKATPPPTNFLDDFGKGFGFPKEAVVIGLILLLAAAVIVIAFKHTGKLKKSFVSQTDLAADADAASAKRSAFNRLRRKAPATNAERVRDVYRRYLGFLKRNGIERHPGSTSGDISELASAVLVNETDELLRALYIKARYSENEITEEDAENAEQAYLDLLNRKSKCDTEQLSGE